jgi:hypothetical protein
VRARVKWSRKEGNRMAKLAAIRNQIQSCSSVIAVNTKMENRFQNPSLKDRRKNS